MLLPAFYAREFNFSWGPLQTASRSEGLMDRAWLLRWSELPRCVAAPLTLARLVSRSSNPGLIGTGGSHKKWAPHSTA